MRRPETAVLHKAPASIIFPGLNYFEKRRPDIIDSLASRMGNPIIFFIWSREDGFE